MEATIELENAGIGGGGERAALEGAEDEEMSQGGGESKGTVAEGDGEDVDGEPEVASKDGNERVERWVKDSGLKVGSDQSKDHDRRSGEQVGGCAMSGGKKYGKEGGAESHPKNAFVHVGDGRPAGDPDADGKTGDQK